MEQVVIRERPILFSAPMVRAILEGRKTVTRRVVKPQPDDSTPGYWSWLARKGLPVGRVAAEALSPFGLPGDRLWGRETWQRIDPVGDQVPASRAGSRWPFDGVRGDGRPIHWFACYRADGEIADIIWRPSIHMPRWASRILLEVVSVRVERLHEITEEDARAEGVSLPERPYPDGVPPHRTAFAALWDEINIKRAPWGSNPWVWGSNPWVWRVEFRRPS